MERTNGFIRLGAKLAVFPEVRQNVDQLAQAHLQRWVEGRSGDGFIREETDSIVGNKSADLGKEATEYPDSEKENEDPRREAGINQQDQH